MTVYDTPAPVRYRTVLAYCTGAGSGGTGAGPGTAVGKCYSYWWRTVFCNRVELLVRDLISYIALSLKTSSISLIEQLRASLVSVRQLHAVGSTRNTVPYGYLPIHTCSVVLLRRVAHATAKLLVAPVGLVAGPNGNKCTLATE